MQYGATPSEWDAFARLNMRDLLPIVCDPNVQPMPGSRVKAGNKTPSYITQKGLSVGIVKWPDKVTASVDDWKLEPRLGICMIMRNVHAIDVDVTDPELAQRIEEFIRLNAPHGFELPKRARENSSKFTLYYRLIDGPEYLKKTTIQVSPNGNHVIEMLHHRQQSVVAGRHPDGDRYYWPDGIPEQLSDIPGIDYGDFAALHQALQEEFMPKGVKQGMIELESAILYNIAPRKQDQVDLTHDPIFAKILELDLYRGTAADGKVFIHCPWKHEHSGDSGETETVYFPQGLGGYSQHPGFKCLHAHCAERTHQAFLNEIGVGDEQFPVVQQSSVADTRPRFTTRGKSSRIEATISNIVKALSWKEKTGYDFFYDAFTDQICYAQGDSVQPIDDDTYTEIRLLLTAIGIEGGGSKEMVRDAISYVAKANRRDTAIGWLNKLKWDGVPRIQHFHTRVLHLADTPYHRAVIEYMWTALAGRVLDPGCKADMVPILIGSQGLRKSTVVEYLSPSKDEFTRIDLTKRDDDLARQLRGKLVAEWEELRGINTRDAQSVKGWITHDKDDWIPKFKEFGTSLPRRFLVIGTTNERRFHNDPTGARRWLPLLITSVIDADYVQEHNEQLWAEAREMFRANGIMFRRAEDLASEVLRQTAQRDAWVEPVSLFINEHADGGWTSAHLLQMACHVPTSHMNHFSQERIRRVMTYLGWEEDSDGRWWSTFA